MAAGHSTIFCRNQPLSDFLLVGYSRYLHTGHFQIVLACLPRFKAVPINHTNGCFNCRPLSVSRNGTVSTSYSWAKSILLLHNTGHFQRVLGALIRSISVRAIFKNICFTFSTSPILMGYGRYYYYIIPVTFRGTQHLSDFLLVGYRRYYYYIIPVTSRLYSCCIKSIAHLISVSTRGIEDLTGQVKKLSLKNTPSN